MIQTVAFTSYVDKEKHEAYNEAVKEIYREVGEKMDFTLVDGWDDLRAMEEEERKAYLEKYEQVQELSTPQVEKLKETVPPVDVKDFVDHIDYLVEKIGIEHVGISSDFDGGGGIEGWQDASETFNITLELVKRGYTEDQIALLWGENLLRVLDEVQQVAKQLQKS